MFRKKKKFDFSPYIDRWYIYDDGESWKEAKILNIVGDRVKVEYRNGLQVWAFSDWYSHPIKEV